MNPAYYVSVCKSDTKKPEDYRLLAGPFATRAEAEAHKSDARREACKMDPRAEWYAFGTCKLSEGIQLGIVNEKLGLKT
jgi:hypothetical protein